MSARHTLAISPDVQDVLRESRIEADRVVLPPRQLDRKLYESVIKVLGEYGAKWNRSAKAIVFPPAARPKIEEALLAGVVKREKVIRQAFYTPDDVADRLIAFAAELLGDTSDIGLLEPSAGGGALVRAAQRRFPNIAVCCVEEDAEAADNLDRSGLTTFWADFLTCRPEDLGRFRLVAANPPYQRGQALKHIAHALRFVARGGVLAAIVPTNFPEEVEGFAFDAEEVGAGAFKESGTGINTKMIRTVRR